MDIYIFVIHVIIILHPLNKLLCPWDSGGIVDLFTNFNFVYLINQLLDIGLSIVLLIRPNLSCYIGFKIKIGGK